VVFAFWVVGLVFGGKCAALRLPERSGGSREGAFAVQSITTIPTKHALRRLGSLTPEQLAAIEDVFARSSDCNPTSPNHALRTAPRVTAAADSTLAPARVLLSRTSYVSPSRHPRSYRATLCRASAVSEPTKGLPFISAPYSFPIPAPSEKRVNLDIRCRCQSSFGRGIRRMGFFNRYGRVTLEVSRTCVRYASNALTASSYFFASDSSSRIHHKCNSG